MRSCFKTCFGRCIYQSPSGYKVYQNAYYCWLTLGSSTLQTLIRRRHPEYPSLNYIHPFIQSVLSFPGDSCLLGLGGGGVIHSLFHSLPELKLVVVEYSHEVIDIAKRYFNITQFKRLTLVDGEASEFLQSSPGLFHHLLIDLHDGQSFPSTCSQESFVINAKRVLVDKGFLAINLIHIHKNQELFNDIRRIFNGCTMILPVKRTSNAIVIAGNMQSTKIFLEKLCIMGSIQKITWNATWGYLGTFEDNSPL